MKLAIMQPYFFPYIGYFSLIKHTDRFIILDQVHFKKHGWISRNRIRKDNNDWIYIIVPLKKKSQNTLIKDIFIDNEKNWKQRILGQLNVYKKVAPFFFEVTSVVKKLFENEYNDIVSLNKDSLMLVCDYLNIQADIEIFSQMNLEIEKPDTPDEWPLNISKDIGNVKEYWNPPGGMDLYNNDKFLRENIKLIFQQMNIEINSNEKVPYRTDLSIIEVMMFNSVEKINEILDNFRLITKT